MIWVVLWSVGVIAFFIFFFRHRLRWLLWFIGGMAALILGLVVQASIMDLKRYAELVDAASRAGRVILISAVVVLVLDLAAMVLYTICYGEAGDQDSQIVTENRPLNAMSLGDVPPAGWSKRKTLVRKSQFITVKSLVSGTATFGERMIVRGIITLFISFLGIWVGIGLLLMRHLWFLILIPVLPGLFVDYNLRAGRRAYQEARKATLPRAPDRHHVARCTPRGTT